MEKSFKREQTKLLQQELLNLLKEVGWDKRKLASEFCLIDEISDRQDLDPDKEYEKIRKALQRETTKPETLHRYIDFIIEHNKKRELYKMPKLPDEYFNEKDHALFNEISAIANQFFENHTRNA